MVNNFSLVLILCIVDAIFHLFAMHRINRIEEKRARGFKRTEIFYVVHILYIIIEEIFFFYRSADNE